MCDLSDDCGDQSDETLLECDNYLRYNFEDDKQPLGFFKPANPSAPFQWIRGNGSTSNRFTGPPFDHTKFSPDGHYLFIESNTDRPEPAVIQVCIFLIFL